MSEWKYARTGEHWYRYDSTIYSAGFDEWGDPINLPGRLEVRAAKYPVIKHTPKGVWLYVYGDVRFVRKDAHKKFACPTIEIARESFIARKEAQIRILSSQLSRAEECIRKVRTEANKDLLGLV